MRKSLFTFKSYLDFLRADIAANSQLRGYQSRLSEVAGCQRSYFSQVIKGRTIMTTEQAFCLTSFWQVSELETEYFLTLIHRERAGSAKLRTHYDRQLARLASDSESIARRTNASTLSEHGVQEYYATWYWVAIHMLISAPGFDTARKIAARLNLDEAQVVHCLARLTSLGIIAKNVGSAGWSPTLVDLHLANSSPMSKINHANWRRRALEDLDGAADNSLHYTAVFALSRADAAVIREDLLSRVVQLRKQIIPSPSEDIYAFNLDWFRV